MVELMARFAEVPWMLAVLFALPSVIALVTWRWWAIATVGVANVGVGALALAGSEWMAPAFLALTFAAAMVFLGDNVLRRWHAAPRRRS